MCIFQTKEAQKRAEISPPFGFFFVLIAPILIPCLGSRKRVSFWCEITAPRYLLRVWDQCLSPCPRR